MERRAGKEEADAVWKLPRGSHHGERHAKRDNATPYLAKKTRGTFAWNTMPLQRHACNGPDGLPGSPLWGGDLAPTSNPEWRVCDSLARYTLAAQDPIADAHRREKRVAEAVGRDGVWM